MTRISRRSLLCSSAHLLGLLAHSLTSPVDAATAGTSNKRGLVFTPNPNYGVDNYIWPRAPSDLNWYYNYQASPSPVYTNYTQRKFEFVPMLWGAPTDISDTTFLQTVKGLVSTQGLNISHVLTFNEPDASVAGGSGIDPKVAAQVWVNNVIPLQKMGIRAGLPACTGGWGGVPWMQQFLGNCSAIISSKDKTTNCTYDFITLHWYGNFDGLASHLGTWQAAFPNTSVWITEWNYDNQDLSTTQAFFNESCEYFDRITAVERYSFFGAFRSSVSNVGPNGAMLSAGGKLTDIGAWYLGEQATGVQPTDTASLSSAPGWSRMRPDTRQLTLAVGVGLAATAALFAGF